MVTRIEQQAAFYHIGIRKKIAPYRIAGLVIWWIIVIMQALWFIEREDLVTVLLTLAGGTIGVISIFKTKYLIQYPISTIMLVGYVSYYFLLPPIVTLMEGKPVTINLLHPSIDLTHAALCLILLLFAFTIYRKFSGLQRLRWLISGKIYQPIGLFDPPSNTQLLLMGILGLLAMGFQYFVAGGYQQTPEGTLNKLMQGLYPLAYLPFVIMVIKLIGRDDRVRGKWLIILTFYTIIFFIVSLARNSRATLFSAIASILLAYLYGLATRIYKVSRPNLRKMALAAITIVILSGPISDLALSMVMVRGMRSEVSAKELVAKTISTFQNKAALEQYRKDTLRNEPSSWYDWSYVENIFMDRLSNLRFSDISLDIALSIKKPAKDFLREIEYQKIMAIFPQPVITLLGLPVDKSLVTSASSGDFMIYAGTGNRNALGGFQTGSIFANGYVLFDWGYPLVFAAIMLVLFPLADSLTTRKIFVDPVTQQRKFTTIFSSLVIISLFSWFVFLTSAANGNESFSGLTTYLLRGWIQAILIYGFAYWITRRVSIIINQLKV